MAKWQRFGDGTWVNVDQVEVVRVEEDGDGPGWKLAATFASGATYALGSAEDREMLVDCTDVLLRDEVGDHLRALAEMPDAFDALDAPEAPDALDTFETPDVIDLRDDSPILAPAPAAAPAFARGRGWRFWRPGGHVAPALERADSPGQADGVHLQPVG